MISINIHTNTLDTICTSCAYYHTNHTTETTETTSTEAIELGMQVFRYRRPGRPRKTPESNTGRQAETKRKPGRPRREAPLTQRNKKGVRFRFA
jgi:hypothetical protein